MEPWYYNDKIVEELPEGAVGFVYLITNLTNNRKYIGKKLAQFKRTKPPLKGKKNKRRSTVESDWRTYYGSSDELNEDVEKLGTQSFKREVLFYCYSKSELSYIEAREQFTHKVLESDEWYNGHIRVRVHQKGILNNKQLNG